MTHSIRIAIADDHKMFLEALSEKLTENPLLKIVSVATNGNELLELLKQMPVDIVVLDLAMPQMNGIETFEFIRKRHKGIKVITVSEHSNISFYRSLYQNGVAAYLPKQCGIEILQEAIEQVHENGNYTRMFNTLPEDAKAYSFSDIEMTIIKYLGS